MTNPWDLLPDDVRDLVGVAVEEFARRPYTGLMPEEHICRFDELVATGHEFDTYRCVLHWSDGVRCNSRSTDQRIHMVSRYVPPHPTVG